MSAHAAPLPPRPPPGGRSSMDGELGNFTAFSRRLSEASTHADRRASLRSGGQGGGGNASWRLSAAFLSAVAAKRLRRGVVRNQRHDDADSTSGEPVEPTSLEELISLQQLELLKAGFDRSESGTLDEREFVAVLKPLLPRHVDDEALRAWFSALDFNGSGTVTWDEFSSYLVHRNQHKLVQEELRYSYQRAEEPAPPLETCHRDMITAMLSHSSTGKVITCGRDGVTRLWGAQTLQHERVIHNACAWITSACFLRDQKRFLIASVDRQLSLFDSQSGNLLRTYAGRKHVSDGRSELLSRKHINDTKKYGVKVDFRRRPLTTVEAGMTFGEFSSQMSDVLMDSKGSSFDVNLTPMLNLLDPPTTVCYIDDGPKEYIGLGLIDGTLSVYPMDPCPMTGRCEAVVSHELHSKGISHVRYSSYLGGIITGSWDGTLKVFNVNKQKEAQVFGGPSGHQKAVCSFDWDDSMQVLASCGSERRVYMWNPFLRQPVFKLDGHQHSLVEVCLNPVNRQLLTLSEDKCIKVWDVRTFRCLQTIADTVNYHPENTVSAMCFDTVRNRVLTGSTYPAAWLRARVSSNFPPNYTGHTRPIVQALFNAKLRQLVTSDRQQVTAWDIDTGAKASQFRPSKQLQQTQQRVGDGITRIALDHRGTRLITATEKSTVVVWNLRNFQVCAVGESATRSPLTECTALIHCQRKGSWFVCCAAGPVLNIYQDSDEGTCLRIADWYHTSDVSGKASPQVAPSITAIALCRDAMYALGLGDGRVVLYNPDISRRCGVLGSRTPGGGVEALQVLHSSPAQHALGAPDAALLAGCSDGNLHLYDITRRKMVGHVQSLPEGEAVLSTLAVHRAPDGERYIAVGDSEGGVHVWVMRCQPEQSGRRKSRRTSGASGDVRLRGGGPRRSSLPRSHSPFATPLSPAPPSPTEESQSEQTTWPAWMPRPTVLRRFAQAGDSITSVAFAEMPRSPLEPEPGSRNLPLVVVGSVDCFCRVLTLHGRPIGTCGVDFRWADRYRTAVMKAPPTPATSSPAFSTARAPKTDLLQQLLCDQPPGSPQPSGELDAARSPASAAPALPGIELSPERTTRRKQRGRVKGVQGILRQRPECAEESAAGVLIGGLIAVCCVVVEQDCGVKKQFTDFFLTGVPPLDMSRVRASEASTADRRPLTAATPLLPSLNGSGAETARQPSTSAFNTRQDSRGAEPGSEVSKERRDTVSFGVDAAAAVARRTARLENCGVVTARAPTDLGFAADDAIVWPWEARGGEVLRDLRRRKAAQGSKAAWSARMSDRLQPCVRNLGVVPKPSTSRTALAHQDIDDQFAIQLSLFEGSQAV